MTIGTTNVSFDSIRIELTVSSQAPFSINTAEAGGYVTLKPCQPNNQPRTSPNGSTPNSISEWFNYNHSYTPPACYSQTLARSTVSKTQACTDYSNNVNKSTYYLSGSCYPLAQNCLIYTEQCCSNSAGADYYSDGTNAFYYDGGITDTAQSCATTTTTTTTTTTAAPTCQCISNVCDSNCFCNGAFCNDASDCPGPSCL